MTYKIVNGDALRTGCAGVIQVRIGGNIDDLASLELEFPSSSGPVRSALRFTRLRFERVYEYRWVADYSTYFLTDRHNFKFALIEIQDSELIERMVAAKAYVDKPVGKRFSPWIDERDLRHYRIGFDDYGTFDVVCLDMTYSVFRPDGGPVE
jgi:hypothetical protein